MPEAAHTSPQVEIPLHPAQLEFVTSRALYRAFVGGRGAGKTVAGVFDMLSRLAPGRTYLVASPTSVMMSDTTFPTFKARAEGLGVWAGTRLTPYPTAYVRVGAGAATVRFRTAEDPEKMRGPNLSGVWLDEASLMPQDAYDICIASLREGGEQGWLSATFTPKGPLHWTYAVFNGGRPDTALFRAKTRDNPFNPPGFHDTVRRQYGDTPFAAQELDGEFVQPAGAVFPADWFNWPGFYVDTPPAEGVTHALLYLDPSWGRQNKNNDDQAFVIARFWPGPRNENLIYLECVPVREDIIAMVSRGVSLCRAHGLRHWDYEINGTMGLLDAEVRRQLQAAGMPHVRAWPVENRANKGERITNALLPYLKNRQIRIIDTPGGRLLAAQLAETPLAPRDDCADAASGAVSGIERLLALGV